MNYKVLLINGSPNNNGCTARALKEVGDILNIAGVETETIHIGGNNISGCKACGCCDQIGKCIIDDLVNEAAMKLKQADGLVIGSPVYYASPNGTTLSFMDRLFHSAGCSLHMKVGAAVVSCRRGGNSSSFDVLNKYFTIKGMPVVSSTYWNQVHGFTASDVEADLEGLQTMRNLGRNMAFLIKAITAEKERDGLPLQEDTFVTSFQDVK